MKAVRLAAGEVTLLRRLLGDLESCRSDGQSFSKADHRAAGAVLAKLTKAEQKNEPSVNAPMIERELCTYSRGKVVPLALPNWPRFAKQATDAGATPADAQMIGAWLARQGWVQMGSQTLPSVLRNWSAWLGKARGSRPASREEGFGDLGQGTTTTSEKPPSGRRTEGFR